MAAPLVGVAARALASVGRYAAKRVAAETSKKALAKRAAKKAGSTLSSDGKDRDKTVTGLLYLLLILAAPPFVAIMTFFTMVEWVEEYLTFGWLMGEPSDKASADIPLYLLEAYQEHAKKCENLPWTVLAAIGKVETNHGRHGGSAVGITGLTEPPIYGIALNGQNGTAVIRDTDGGRLDNDTVWDRAVGPFQFIPTSWEIYGHDTNHDGIKDPQNFYDAIAAAVKHLCPDGKIADLRDAIYSYNHSLEYVEKVLHWAELYSTQPDYAPPPVGDIVSVQSWHVIGVTSNGASRYEYITVDLSIADNLKQLLDDAKRDGIIFGGWGWRSHEEQIRLRAKNCGGDTYYNKYKKPSSQCNPPTAIPGTSQHELGLAIDFTCNGRELEGTACFRWLQRNAANYGLINFKKEPWHWSTTGN